MRKRWEDIPDLVRTFVTGFNQELNMHIKKVSKQTMDCLMKYDWPGNVRELKNTIQRAVLLSKGTRLLTEYLPERIISGTLKEKQIDIDIGLPLREVEKRYIERMLWWLGGNKAKTAKALGISRRALYNKLEEYNI